MNCKNAPALGVVLALVLATAGTARADYFFNWGPDNPVVFSDHAGMHVTLTDGDQIGPVSGTQHMIATSLGTFINPGVTGTDNFSHGQKLALGLDLTDGMGHGNVSFSIGVSGSLSAANSAVSYSFLDGTTRSLTVNSHPYTVTINGPGPIPGTIMATITPGLAPTTGGGGGVGGTGGSGGTPQSAPEPSTIVLSALGAAGGLLGCLRGWRDGQRSSGSRTGLAATIW
jgi:hypothetical protein